MIKGIGLDVIELNRIKQLLDRQGKFVHRILTESEVREFTSLSEQRKIEYFAGRFAVKEAYAKARGTGIGAELSFQDIEINKDPNGRPYLSQPTTLGENVQISITHTKQNAAAVVIIETM
ncbi:holo-ACP synthase [Bacillus sp. 2205SS5-2]|uniref:holo-ACP synthase n=1 Tax=Bacillus sp. 2205SS5-2 TaxID=3109031 RepID=UPI003006A9D8